LALISDAWHMFTDLLGFCLCLLAGTMALKPPTSGKTYGYYRVEILSALANGITLVAVASYIFYEAYLRILRGAEVKTLEMITIAVIGLTANLSSATVLYERMLNLNVKAAFLHVVGDTLSSVGVVGAGIIMFFTHWYQIDSIISVIVGAVIVFGTGKMLREVLNILLEGTPRGISLSTVVQTIRSIEGIVDIHDIHVWSMTSYMHYLSAHLVVQRNDLGRIDEILNEVKNALAERYRINHSTLQIEAEGYKEFGEVHDTIE
jgi:cobalt-zinc-cadmium efflux system protein